MGAHSHPARVLVVMLRPQGSPARATGGGQISMIQTAVGLQELGAHVIMLEGRPSILSGSTPALEAYELGRDRSILRDTIGVMDTVRKTKCESIYAFSDFFPETVVPSLLASLLARKRLFMNVTSMAHRDSDGRRFLGLIRRRVRSNPEIGSLLDFVAFHASRRLACRTGTCLVANPYMEAYTKSRLHASHTFVVGAGVEDFWYERKAVEKSFDGVYCGRFDPSKRVPVLITAWQQVVRRKPDSRLLLIGESGEEYQLVKRLVVDLGLSANVVFAGYIEDRRALAEMFRSARVFVFPSVQEGFGLVIAEAMAAGLPCVLSDVEPLRGVFGEAAIMVKANDPSAFADAVLGLMDEGKRAEYSARSESVAKRFSWGAVSEKVLEALGVP